MDYLGPKIINQVYGVDSWTPSKERQFDEVCENVVLGMDKLESLWNLLREARSSKPVFHFVGTLMFFFSLAARLPSWVSIASFLTSWSSSSV